ncbi:MAG: POTRA domain-containing protein, partial [Acidobacteriota bacterium]
MNPGAHIRRRTVRPGGWRLRLRIFLPFLFLWSSGALAQGPALPIKVIEFRGNRRVEEATIRFYVTTRVGDSFSVSKLRQDVEKIYELGFFRDVRVDVGPFEGGLRVVFILEEKPSVSNVRIVGNKKLKSEDIQEKVTVAVQSILDQGTVRESVEAIRGLYQENGYYFIRVDSVVEEAGANQVNVEFRITEGEKVN